MALRPAKKKKIFSNKIRTLLLLIFSINSLFGCAPREMHDDLHNFHAYKKALPCTCHVRKHDTTGMVNSVKSYALFGCAALANKPWTSYGKECVIKIHYFSLN